MKNQNEVKRINFNLNYFEAGGKKYHMDKTLSVERWRHFEDLQPLLMMGRSAQDIFTQVKKTYEKYNEGKYADGAVLLHNLMIGIKDHLENRYDPALMLSLIHI